MTTATPPTAATAAGPPTTVVEVWAEEKKRLTAAVEAAKEQLTALQDERDAVRTRLGAAESDLASLDQDASRQQQLLAAATTGPERHRIELELDAITVRRLRALRRRVDAAIGAASTTAAITRQGAAAGVLAAELTTAEATLTRATTDADAASASREGLEATVARVRTGVTDLGPRRTEAEKRLVVLLGAPDRDATLRERLQGVAAQDVARRDALAAAEETARTAETARAPVEGALAQATLRFDRALAAIRDAQAAPLRLVAAAAAVEAVLVLPDIPDQKAVDAAATGTDDPTTIPVTDPPATALENWAIKLPATVTLAALGLVEAGAVLDELATLDAAPRLEELAAAETAAVVALLAQREAARTRETAAAAAVAARDEVAAHEATAADRLALAVSGN